MNRLPKFALLCWFSILAPVALAELPAGWSTNYLATRAEATARQEPTLVYFTASWCGPCKLVSQVILADPVIRAVLADTERVAVDIDASQPVAKAFNINAVPTFLILAADGEEARRTTGFQSAPDFLEWLTNSLAETRAATVQTVQFKSQLADIDRQLAATNSVEWAPVAATLFGLCAAHNQAVVAAAEKSLTTLANRAPGVVLPGLNDARLVTRLKVANILHARLGEAFDVDPWSDEATRKQGVETWLKRIAMAKP